MSTVLAPDVDTVPATSPLVQMGTPVEVHAPLVANEEPQVDLGTRDEELRRAVINLIMSVPESDLPTEEDIERRPGYRLFD